MDVTESGMTMDAREVQPRNVSDPMDSTDLPMVTDASLVHP